MRQGVGPEASVLGRNLLDDICQGFEEHKEGRGEVLRNMDMANLTKHVQEASSPTWKGEGTSYLPERFRAVSMSGAC